MPWELRAAQDLAPGDLFADPRTGVVCRAGSVAREGRLVVIEVVGSRWLRGLTVTGGMRLSVLVEVEKEVVT